MTVGSPLMKKVLMPLAKSVLLALELSVGMSGSAIQKKIYGSGTIALVILNEEMEDTMKMLNRLKNQVY